MSLTGQMDRALLLIGAAFFVLIYSMAKDGLHGKPVPVLVDVSAVPPSPSPPAADAPAQVPVATRTVSLGHGKTATLKHRYAIEGAILAKGR